MPPSARYQPQVFISYQRADGDFARRIREHLAAHGVKTWMDQFDIPIGSYWPDEIDKGLAGSDIVVGVLSPDAVESRNVNNECDDLPTAAEWLATHERWLDWSGAVLGRADHHLLLAEYYRLSRDIDAALSEAAAAVAAARDPRQPLTLIAATRFHGELMITVRQFAIAAQNFEESLTLADACEAPFERALTLLAVAELRAAAGDSDAARQLVAEVRTICEPLGARPTLERVAALERLLDSVAN